MLSRLSVLCCPGGWAQGECVLKPKEVEPPIDHRGLSRFNYSVQWGQCKPAGGRQDVYSCVYTLWGKNRGKKWGWTLPSIPLWLEQLWGMDFRVIWLQSRMCLKSHISLGAAIWPELCTQLLCSSAWCGFSRIQLQGALTTWNTPAYEAGGTLQPPAIAKHSWL